VRERVTVGQGVPTQWRLLLGHPDFESSDLTSLRIAGTGAATVPPEISKEISAGTKPPSTLSADERNAWDQLSVFYLTGLGYAQEMSLKPQTLYAIADSPVGLAAWILDHDVASYRLIRRVFDGQTEGLTRDDILDNITMYWLTNTAVSSGRLYWDNAHFPTGGFFDPRVAGGQLGNGAMGNARWTGVRLRDILDRKVAGHETVGKASECDRHQNELRARRRDCNRHQRAIAPRCTEHRHDALRERDQQRQDQCKMADLRNHRLTSCMLGIDIAVFCCALSMASFTSGGM